MNPFSLIPAPYQLLAKGIGLLILVIALWAAWHAFTGHYIDIGVAKQQLADRQNEIKAMDSKRAKESLAAVQQMTVLNKLTEDKDNERKALETTIADLKSGKQRMRIITANAINNMPSTPASTSGTPQTCSVELPREIGESAIAIGSEANELADKYRALQAIVIQDRKTCN